jgi:cell division transport system permease protein
MTLLNRTWRHIRRSPFQSLMAYLTMSITFTALTLFLFLNFGLAALLNHFESKPEITIFLKDGLDKATIESVQNELSSFPEVKEVRFISKEKALSIYKDQNKNNPLLTEMVSSSILPASFEVAAYSPKTLELIATDFSGKTNIVDEIIYQKDIINSLLSWTTLVRKIGYLAISFLGLIAFFMIFVIIGLKITNRKEEINISRSLGASKSYVKKPFLVEGAIYGLLGSFTGYSLILILMLNFSGKINLFFQPVNFISSNLYFYLISFFVEIILGLSVGLMASFAVSKRYIKW